jgi:hypothetical protein
MSKNIDVKCRRASQVLSACKLVTTFSTHQSQPSFLPSSSCIVHCSRVAAFGLLPGMSGPSFNGAGEWLSFHSMSLARTIRGRDLVN